MLATNMKHRSAASTFRWRCRHWHRWVAHNSAFPRARGLVHDAEVKLRQRGVQPGLDCEEGVLDCFVPKLVGCRAPLGFIRTFLSF